MGEISQSGGGGHKKGGGKVRAKKSSTRIDMTPMVDLAFLLLTFFVMTTTLNKPQTMEIVMPEKTDIPEDQPKVNEAHVLTLLLGEDDKVYWYIGITDPKIEVTNFSAKGIRKILLEKKRDIPKLVILIKPSDKSKYKNMVDILDEMNIDQVKTYALVDITPVDEDLIKDYNGSKL